VTLAVSASKHKFEPSIPQLLLMTKTNCSQQLEQNNWHSILSGSAFRSVQKQ